VVAVTGDLQGCARAALEHVERVLDALVLLHAPEVEQRRVGGLGHGRELAAVQSAVHDVDPFAPDAEGDQVLA